MNPIEAMFSTETVDSIDFETFLEEEFGQKDDFNENFTTEKEVEIDIGDIESLLVMPRFNRELMEHEKTMAETIQEMDRRSWSRRSRIKNYLSSLNTKVKRHTTRFSFCGWRK